MTPNQIVYDMYVASIYSFIYIKTYIKSCFIQFNTLMLFWPILGQRKISLVIFLWKRRTSSVVFLATILFLIAYIKPLEIILAKKTTELVLIFHKKKTKSIFLWPNMGQKSIKVVNNIYNITGKTSNTYEHREKTQ